MANFEKFRAGLSFLAENQFQWHTIKAESFTDLIHQVSLVRKMDAFGVADKEDESGWFDICLGCVRNMHLTVGITRQRVSPHGFFHQIV